MEFAGKELKLVNFKDIYNEKRVLEIFVQILLGFKYLHDQYIVHCNLTLKVIYLLLFYKFIFFYFIIFYLEYFY
jgi:serine/threonine protein kinase